MLMLALQRSQTQGGIARRRNLSRSADGDTSWSSASAIGQDRTDDEQTNFADARRNRDEEFTGT